MDIIELIANIGGTLGLAIFAIWRLDQAHKARIEELKEEREQLRNSLDRNTQAWQKATETMSSIATGVAVLVSSIDYNRKELSDIRVLLARRPCVADAAVREPGGTPEVDGHPPTVASGAPPGPRGW